MPTTPAGRKMPLADITQRTLTGRRLGNTSTQSATNLPCPHSGEENTPSRGLLDIFAAAQANSLQRKRSLKLASEDSENIAPSSVLPFSTASLKASALSSIPIGGGAVKASPTERHAALQSNNAPYHSQFTRSFAPGQRLGIVRSFTWLQAYGQQKNKPFYVSTRLCMKDFISRPNDVYTFVSQDATTLVPPFSCAYNNVANDARNLAIGDEDGTIHIVDTKKDDTHPEHTVQILAHQNAIFDLCWTKDDSRIISVSGDQTARIHDVETRRCVGTFSGHSGSIKSVSRKYEDDNIFATAGRDGSVLVWDVRCSSSTSPQGDLTFRPADRLLNVHSSSARPVPPKRTKHGSDGPNTASAVQYMIHNEHIIASTGTLDGLVKYWDVRKHGTYFKHDFPAPLQTSTYTPTTKRAHGMTSMALSPDGISLYAVSSDNHIYRFNSTALGGPVEQYGGNNYACSSYYIKISVSPDGNFIAAGSSKDLYVWEVNRPDRRPLVFQGHEREVTGVDWAKDLGNGTQLSGCSDDATVRTWKSNPELCRECRENKSLLNMHSIVSE